MKTLAEFLVDLANNNITLWVEEESLCCKAPLGIIDPGLKAELTERKAEIIAYLGTDRSPVKYDAPPSSTGRLPSRVSALRQFTARSQVLSPKTSSTNVGIHALELYFPNHAVSQADMEQFHNVEGKYTGGLGQKAVTFCGDNEDAISMALTVVHRLMERYEIDWGSIGRLEVGTESLVDRSKSIKTHLMSLFGEHGYHDIEGVDSYNACYGGTAALFNTIAWCQSEAWDGRYGLVVCVDIADLNEEQSFLNGAAAVAMLIGPHAPMVMQRERASHIMHTWDFYKPVGWKDSFPLMRDGKHSIDVYLTCLDGCQKALTQKLGISNLLRHDDYFVFHCTSTYLCKRAFDYLATNAEPDLSLKERQALYQQKTNPSSLITQQIGSTYTASCYVNLCSLLIHERERIQGKTICVYSYGSGATASAYRLKVVDLPKFDWGVLERLNQRQWYTPENFIKLTQDYSQTYGRFDFKPIDRGDRLTGVYYLEQVDEWGRRYYSRHGSDLELSYRKVESLIDPNSDWPFGTLLPLQVNSSKPVTIHKKIDLKAEAVLDSTIYPGSKSSLPVTEPASILLTGATGFLGAFLLYELLQQTQAQIYCLVRADNTKLGKNRIQNNLESYELWNQHFQERIIPVVGDISQPHLGLPPEQFQWMASQIDIIYHSAALLNFTYSYKILKPINVLGTQEVLRLASQIKVKPVHYVSTTGVFNSFNSSAYHQKVLTESTQPFGEEIYHGYPESKWVAEKLVMMARERGIPVCIYRPPLISGHSKTGIWNTDDFICRIIKGCIQMGSIADFDWRLDLSPVDYVSRAIVYLSRQKELIGKVFHLNNPQPTKWRKFGDSIRSLGYSMDWVSYNSWLAQLDQNGRSQKNSLYPLLDFLADKWSEEQLTVMDMFTSIPQISCQETLSMLAGSNIVCPPVNAELLNTYFSYFIRSGFLDVQSDRVLGKHETSTSKINAL